MDGARSRCFKQANIKEKITLDRDSLLSCRRGSLMQLAGAKNIFEIAGHYLVYRNMRCCSNS